MPEFPADAIYVRGNIQVHQLDFTLGFQAERRHGSWEESGVIYLGVDLRLSDGEYQIASAIISRETGLQVMWQDQVGKKHFI